MAPKPKPKKTTVKKRVVPMPMVESDKKWQIESDARTLKQAMEVKGDPARMKAAQDYCLKEMDSLKAVSKMKSN